MERTLGDSSQSQASGHAPPATGRKPAHIRLAAPVLLSRWGRFLSLTDKLAPAKGPSALHLSIRHRLHMMMIVVMIVVMHVHVLVLVHHGLVRPFLHHRLVLGDCRDCHCDRGESRENVRKLLHLSLLGVI